MFKQASGTKTIKNVQHIKIEFHDKDDPEKNSDTAIINV